MTSDDGMDWLDATAPADEPAEGRAQEYETAGRSARLALFNVVRAAFDEHFREEGLTRKELAQRIGVAPTQVSRLLLRPTNMTIETAAKLMLAMGEELVVRRRDRDELCPRHAGRPSAWHYTATSFGLFGFAQVGSGSALSNTPIRANAIFVDAGPSLRTLTIHGSGCDADGVWEQVAHASRTGATPPMTQIHKEDEHA